DLAAVHLAPTIEGPEDLTRRSIGRLGAQVLAAAIRDGAIVGIGDGSSVSAVAGAMDDAAAPRNATVVPLAGGFCFGEAGHEPFRRVADALGATVRGLLAPGLVDDATTKRSLVAHAGIRAVLELWERLDVALFGIGGPTWTEAAVGERIVRELDA